MEDFASRVALSRASYGDIVGYHYQGDIYCAACMIEWAKEELPADVRETNDAEAYLTAVAESRGIDREDEGSFDSGDFPKVVLYDHNEADTPQHCGNGASCKDALVLEGRRFGAFIPGPLTSHGNTYVVNLYKEDRSNPLARFWMEAFDYLKTDPALVTPEGHTVIERDEDAERIVIESPHGDRYEVGNVARDDEDHDRYAVFVNGQRYTDQLRAPASPGPSWSADPVGSAADAAVAFYEDDHGIV